MSGVGNISNVNMYANMSASKVQEKVSSPTKNSDSNGGKSIESKPTDTKSQKAASDVNILTNNKEVTKDTSRSNDNNMSSDTLKKANADGRAYAAGGVGKERAEVNARNQQGENASNTAAKDTHVVTNRQKFEQQEQGRDDQTSTKDNKANQSSYSNHGVKRRSGRPYDEDEDEDDASKRRRKQATFLQQPKKPLTILEGAKVGESQTQDMFISSSVTAERISGKISRSIVDQIKEYNLGPLGCDVYDAVYANSNGNEKNGIGPNMQKDLFAEIMKSLAEVDDVMTASYRRVVRDVVQGAMQAGYDTRIDLKDIVKMLVSGFMAMSPHDDDPRIMVEAIKHIVSEVMYGKINIGYNMKTAAGYLGAALHTLQLYYKNYQQDIQYTSELEQKINTAFSENIWKATGEISNYSQAYAKANIEQFMTGKQDEERAYSKNYVKDMVFSPLKKVFNKSR